MARRTITSANATLTLSCPQVFAVPQPIEQFSTDDAFDTEPVKMAEVQMGVDGTKSAGFLPYLVKQKIVLQANSPSNDVFDQIRQAQRQAGETFEIGLTLTLPSVGKIHNFLDGTVETGVPVAPGKKVLGPQTYEITFDDVTTAPM